MKRMSKILITSLAFLCLQDVIQAQQGDVAQAESDLTAASASNLAAIPPLPGGKSTILGGSIHDIDPILDRFTLNIIGEKPLRILYDERTQIYLDGKKISLRDLRPAEHASVQTTLDGTSVFAISVHILSQLQQGDYSGEVLGYSPETGDLDLVSGVGAQSVRVRVSSDTKFARKGQGPFTATPASAADLQPGSLVSIRFEPDGKGRGTATEITLLATPGSRFVFSGSVIALDTHSGLMVLLDPLNNQSYQIAFAPGSISALQDIHSGQRVRVTAQYDGTRYLAQEVSPY